MPGDWRRARSSATGLVKPEMPGGWGHELIECLPAESACDAGKTAPGAVRNDLSRSFGQPDFRHFQTDRAGNRLVTDCGPYAERGGRLFLADLGQAGRDAVTKWTFLLDLNTSNKSMAHPHPFLSPDGTRAFFNSDESGILHAYMITELDTIQA